MNLDAVFVVNESKNVISRDRVTAVLEDKLVYVIVIDVDRFLLVETFLHHKVLSGCFLLFVLATILTEEWYERAPSYCACTLPLTDQLVNVFVAENYSLVSY